MLNCPAHRHVRPMSDSAKILVVDDEPLNLEIIAEQLDDPTYQLQLFDSSLEAWAHLQSLDSGTYDLILLDRMMPGMDGIRLLRELKADTRFRNTPVVMQTAACSPEEVREGIAAGALYYLAKPYSTRELLAIVHSALTKLATSADAFPQAEGEAVSGDVFEFSSLAEARLLATRLSLRCPEPALAALGLGELLINAIEHGNLGITYSEKTALRLADTWEEEVERRLALPEYVGRKARVEVRQAEGAWIFTVSDCGNGFDWHGYLTIAPERAYDPNGRGIAMARHLSFASLEYRGCGNIAVATIRTEPTS